MTVDEFKKALDKEMDSRDDDLYDYNGYGGFNQGALWAFEYLREPKHLHNAIRILKLAVDYYAEKKNWMNGRPMFLGTADNGRRAQAVLEKFKIQFYTKGDKL